MRLCFECGGDGAERHHVVPRSRGGRKTVLLCSRCHGLVHGVRRQDIATLTREGLQRARARGVVLGRRHSLVPADVRARAKALYASPMSTRAVGETLLSEGHAPPGGGNKWAASTLWRIINDGD